MLTCTTWKVRQLSPEQLNRMMATWAKLEAKTAEDPNIERLCWYITSDGSEGVTVSRATDADAAAVFELETCVALNEFLEMENKTVLDLDTSFPAIVAGIERANDA
jgi:hypothetical protein